MPKYDKADLERRMHGAVESLKHDLAGLRTGRANTALLWSGLAAWFGPFASLPVACVVHTTFQSPASFASSACSGPVAASSFAFLGLLPSA